MARRPSLKPQLNQIRTWVGEGVTDIWIAHQLDRTPAEVAEFRRKHGLLGPGEEPPPAKASRAPRTPKAQPAAEAPKRASRSRKPTAAAASAGTEAEATETAPSEGDADATAKRRRRGRRGGRGRGKARTAIPATLEHGPDGVVIRIDAAVLESAAYRESWAEVTTGGVTVTATGIAIAAVVAEPDDAGDAADDDA